MGPINKILPIALVFLLALGIAPTALAAEQIIQFSSHLTINQDTSIDITETIHYTTNETKHGIFRYIPVRYNRDGWRFTAKISDIGVADPSGTKIPFTHSISGGNLTLKIGDPDKTFSGQQIYVISYRVDNAVQQLPNETPQLYWDITGEGWTIPITSASASVVSPYADITLLNCFGGPFGGDDGQCRYNQADAQRVDFSYPQPLGYGDNFTVQVQLDSSGNLVFPTKLQRLTKSLWDNLVLIPIMLPGIIMLSWWWHRGRDWVFLSGNIFHHDDSQPQTRHWPGKQRHVPLVYEPLQELTPAETGALLDERVDNQDIVAEIIDLARQKIISIERIEKKRLIGSSTDYRFIKLKHEVKNLPLHQEYLLTHLFTKGESVLLSDLKGSFSTHWEKSKQLVFDSLHDKGMFTSHPSRVRLTAFLVAGTLLLATGAWTIQLIEQGIWWSIPLFILSSALASLSAYSMPAKSAKGSNYARQALGLQHSIRRGAWREKIKEKHLYFEEVLPFAVALGVVDKLTRDMEKLDITPPQYTPVGVGTSWSTGDFVSSFTTQASSGLSYNPSSSSMSSGGGSSGGGGGGGGGGSW